VLRVWIYGGSSLRRDGHGGVEFSLRDFQAPGRAGAHADDERQIFGHLFSEGDGVRIQSEDATRPRRQHDVQVRDQDKSITVNNPAIWRPILSIQDAVSAYTRAIEANPGISGIFNIASGNYTVGEIADSVKAIIEEKGQSEIKLNIGNATDFRSYKVSIEKARNVLSFRPKHDIDSIVKELADNLPSFRDFSNPQYYNIEVFKSLRV
jgi:hypothetical protein